MAKDRTNYFRARTKIGRLELKAQLVCDELGHEFFMIRDDKSATSFGCRTCETLGCAEVDGDNATFHGSIFEYKCGEAPRSEIDDEKLSILAAIYR